MKLVELIQQEQEGLAREGILFLRHATNQIEMLEHCGATLQEYTAIQPVGSKFDFHLTGRPFTEVVVVIVRDRVHAVYRVAGITATGNGADICSAEYRKFELYKHNGKSRVYRQCHKFSLVAVKSGSDGCEVRGWAGKEIMPVQRSDGGFFDQIEVSADPIPRFAWNSSTWDPEWTEGTVRLRLHLIKERASGLAERKKRAFVERWGRLFCERCREDPVQKYGTEAAKACIEVHHSTTAVKMMKEGHVTTLDDLKCLCANCHRLVHAELSLHEIKA